MSLKPPKKSDLGKAWLSKRSGKNIPIYPEYHLIVTEGTETEPLYFDAIKRRINSKFSDRINLKVTGRGENTTSLFYYAKEVAENGSYKHVWIVYDTDDFPKDKIDTVKLLCDENSHKNCEYHAIWSNQCIELWYLLHFSYMHSDLHRNDYFPKLSNHLGFKYQKDNPDMFKILLPHLNTALKNATKLDQDNAGKMPSQSKPGTKVFELIERLKPYI